MIPKHNKVSKKSDAFFVEIFLENILILSNQFQNFKILVKKMADYTRFFFPN